MRLSRFVQGHHPCRSRHTLSYGECSTRKVRSTLYSRPRSKRKMVFAVCNIFVHHIFTNHLFLFLFALKSQRDEVLKSFQSNPFFQSWDPSVLNLYVKYGTYLTTDPHNSGRSIVQLKTSAIQEAVVFTYDHLTQRETFQRMTELDESIPLRWVVPGRPGHLDSVGGPGDTARRVWVRPRNSTNVKIKGAGHLVSSTLSGFSYV
jgi:hypothetical protein